jgi:hypothetical protein
MDIVRIYNSPIAAIQDVSMKMHGFHYPASAGKPVLKVIPVQANRGGRSPRLDIILNQAAYPNSMAIHHTIVTVRRKNKNTRWHIFFLNGRKLRDNKCIAALKRRPGAAKWSGDVVVMKEGKSQSFVGVNGGADRRLANYAVKGYVLKFDESRHGH